MTPLGARVRTGPRPNLVIYGWTTHQDLRFDTKHDYIWRLTFYDPFRGWGQGQSQDDPSIDAGFLLVIFW